MPRRSLSACAAALALAPVLLAQTPAPTDRDEVSAALERGLAWLVLSQAEDGGWRDGAEPDVGATGLAVLAFLGSGSTLRVGPHLEMLKRGVSWLRDHQDPERGSIAVGDGDGAVGDHAVAAWAVVEAHGLSEYKILRKPAQRAVDFLLASRTPDGAWGIQPASTAGDVAVTGWGLVALRAATDYGLEVEADAVERADAWLGRLGSVPAGRAGDREVAIAFGCRLISGGERDDAWSAAQSDRLLGALPVAVTDARSPAFWLWGSLGTYQLGGRHWRSWMQAAPAALLAAQRRDGPERGSWDPAEAAERGGGRVGSTAACCLALQTFRRYAKLVR